MFSLSDAKPYTFSYVPLNLMSSTRVGTDHLFWMSGRVGNPKKKILNVGSGRVGLVIWSVGCRSFSVVTFAKKIIKTTKINRNNEI